MAAWPAPLAEMDSLAKAPARNKLTKGVTMPSLSPLSTLSMRRTREGIRSSDMIVDPSAASVGATMAPRAAATQRPLEWNSPTASAAPAPIVSGSPIPSRRAGMAMSVAKVHALTREASEKSTRARVISANERMVDECSCTWTRTTGPWVTANPSRTKAMGAVTCQRSRRADTSPQTTKHAATTANAASLGT